MDLSSCSEDVSLFVLSNTWYYWNNTHTMTYVTYVWGAWCVALWNPASKMEMSSCNLHKLTWYWRRHPWNLFTSAMAKVMFSLLSVALSVRLSVSNITEKRLNGFSWNLQGRWDFIEETIVNIFNMFHLTPWTQDFFPLFRSNPCLLAALQKNGWTDFHEILRNRRTWHREQSGIFSGCYNKPLESWVDLSISRIHVCL